MEHESNEKIKQINQWTSTNDVLTTLYIIISAMQPQQRFHVISDSRINTWLLSPFVRFFYLSRYYELLNFLLSTFSFSASVFILMCNFLSTSKMLWHPDSKYFLGRTTKSILKPSKLEDCSRRDTCSMTNFQLPFNDSGHKSSNQLLV